MIIIIITIITIIIIIKICETFAKIEIFFPWRPIE